MNSQNFSLEWSDYQKMQKSVHSCLATTTSGVHIHHIQNTPFVGDTLYTLDAPNGQKHFMVLHIENSHMGALLGNVLAYEVLTGMVKKGFALEHIVREMNDKFKVFLGGDIQCEVLYLIYNFEDKTLHFWNGTSQPFYIFDKRKQALIKKEGSEQPVSNPEFNKQKLEIVTIPQADNYSFYYENKKRARNSFEAIFKACEEQSFSNIKSYEEETLSWILVPEKLSLEQKILEEKESNHKPVHMQVSFHLDVLALQSWEPLPAIMHVLMEPKGLRPYRTEIFTILTELYTNALDHGVLGLDSKIKKSPEGILAYYHEKQKRLEKLKDGHIDILILLDIRPESNGFLKITVEDSGKGFCLDSQTHNPFSGRGLSLIQALCKRVDFFKNGAKVEAIFEWNE